MDGNGRWAKKRGLPRTAGHSAGVEKAKEVILTVKDFGIPYVSLYTFSKENWKRSESEISFLMNLIITHFKNEFNFYIKNKIKIVHIGDRSGISKEVMKTIDHVVEETKNFISPTVLLAFNYSGKYDIIQGINRIIKDKINEIDELEFSDYLLTKDYPDPDLIIRTSGEFRISNYFLWQSAYSEYYITDKFWPDLTKEDIINILNNFEKRDRRYGEIKEK
ncbi:MAG: di-trans,poly-cis-decaprenylcistransferase [Spirochaetes bacterium]|nr:di-trans,poly-cis-decaprenylcistransferase [Spirochaetota bacterium]